MSLTPAIPQTSNSTAAGPIGAKASRGAFLLTFQAIVLKFITFGGGVILTRFISPSAVGLFNMASNAAGFPALIQNVGGTEILIQRSGHFRRWANASFWMSLALGLLSALLVLLMAPLAGFYYAQNHAFNHQVVPLVALFSLGPFMACFYSVPAARLQTDLRFGFQARLNLVLAIVLIGTSIFLAWQHFNAYALLLPLLVTTFIRGIVFWIVAPVPIKKHLDVKRWKYLVGDRGYLLAAAVFQTIIATGDNITLGRLRGEDITGIYSWAFSLSMQSSILIGLNLAAVLFPSLSRLNTEPQRLAAAFYRSLRILVVVGIPLCFLQAVVASPLIHLLYRTTWHRGIGVFQILSIGAAFQIVSMPVGSLLNAQGRFRFLMFWNAATAILFLIIVVSAASLYEGLNSAIAVSVGVTMFFLITGPLALAIAFRGVNLPVSNVWRVYAVPLFASLSSGAAAWYLLNLLPTGRPAYYILQIAAASAIMLGLYALLVYLLNPLLMRECYGLLHDVLLHRLFKKRTPA